MSGHDGVSRGHRRRHDNNRWKYVRDCVSHKLCVIFGAQWPIAMCVSRTESVGKEGVRHKPEFILYLEKRLLVEHC